MKTDLKLFKSFSFRLSLKFTAVVASAVILVTSLLIFITNKTVFIRRGIELVQSYDEVVRVLSFPKSEDFEFYREPLFILPYYISYTVYNEKEKKTLVSNDPFIPVILPVTQKPRVYFEKNYFSDGNLKILYYARNYKLVDFGDVKIIIAVYIDSDYFSKLFPVIPYVMVPALLFILIVSFIISFSITSRTIQPVIRITSEAKSRSICDIDKALPVSKRDDEIDQLAKTFNELFVQIKKDFERERQFSSDVSHELKTPLSVISGQTNLLLRWGKENPEQLETSLNSIKAETKSMQTIIENLLKISRYESGRLKPEISSFKVSELFETLKKEFLSIENIEKTSPLTINCRIDEEIILESDFDMLHQIFTAFISNSIKYAASEKGLEIELAAEKQEGKIILSEADNGPGFKGDEVLKVFDRFYMGDQARTRELKNKSSGLGLSIAKTMSQALGAEIYASNKEEGGAKLTLIL